MCGLVFSTTDGNKSISGFSQALNRIRTQSNTDGWGFHDLRRTLATNLAKHKTPDTLISAILNHSTKALQGITSVYNRHDLMTERTDALNKYAIWCYNLVNNKDSDTIIQFPKSKG